MTKKITHIHHIIPKHMGGTNSADNLVELTIEEHAEAHRLLYEQHGNKFDYIAYMALSNQISNAEATYLKLLGPKKWTKEGKQKLSDLAKLRKGDKNPFYGKNHSEETKQKLRSNCKNDWIKEIDPSLLPYTKYYIITYPNGETKKIAGLKEIAREFNVSITNVYNTIKRMSQGKLPTRSVFAGHFIKEVD